MPKFDPRKLLKAAKAAAGKGHAPYSGFHVGAALWTSNGAIFTGCNVENASYGLTNCAERTAMFTAVAAGQKKIRAVAIVADGKQKPYPCGACRQVLAEFGNPDTPVFVSSLDRPDQVETFTLGDLLPHAFIFKPRHHTP